MSCQQPAPGGAHEPEHGGICGGDLPADTPHGPGDLLGCVNALEDARGCGFGALCRVCPLRLAVVKTFKSGHPSARLKPGLFLARNGIRREVPGLRVHGPGAVAGPARSPGLPGRHHRAQAASGTIPPGAKMEAIGQLLGGIAHDFNNVLWFTLLHLNFLNQKQNLDPGMADSLRELEKGIQRAAGLTRQLLQFRAATRASKREDFNEVVKGLMKMLGRLLGENIDMDFTPDSQPVWVEADAGRLRTTRDESVRQRPRRDAQRRRPQTGNATGQSGCGRRLPPPGGPAGRLRLPHGHRHRQRHGRSHAPAHFPAVSVSSKEESRRVCLPWRRMPSALTIWLTTTSAPRRLHDCRKSVSLIPASGARYNLLP